jgi:hypothetical protein
MPNKEGNVDGVVALNLAQVVEDDNHDNGKKPEPVNFGNKRTPGGNPPE